MIQQKGPIIIRRVVTGHNADGESVIVADEVAPRAHTYAFTPGMFSALVWATPSIPAIPSSGDDPTIGVTSYVPEPGATRLIVNHFPPDAVVMGPGYDVAAAVREQLEMSPGLGEKFEPDVPGMHTTDTVDYAILLEGELWLEVGNEPAVHLSPGDVVIQQGTRHAWRNRSASPAIIAFILIGAHRATK